MPDEPNIFGELRQLVAEYLDARIRLFQLEAYEKIAKVSAALFSSLFIALLGFFLLFFLSLSGGFYLGELFGSLGMGFLCVTAVYALLFVFVLVKKKSLIEKGIINRIIGELTSKEAQDE